MELYDLVKVIKPGEDYPEFKNAIGIIKDIKYDLFEILFIGKKLNDLSISKGRLLFTDKEIEGV